MQKAQGTYLLCFSSCTDTPGSHRHTHLGHDNVNTRCTTCKREFVDFTLYYILCVTSHFSSRLHINTTWKTSISDLHHPCKVYTSHLFEGSTMLHLHSLSRGVITSQPTIAEHMVDPPVTLRATTKNEVETNWWFYFYQKHNGFQAAHPVTNVEFTNLLNSTSIQTPRCSIHWLLT